MLRKLGKGLAVLAFVLPSSTLALSVDNYQVNSYLKQPLDVVIELSDIGNVSEDQLRIKLASEDDFKRAGIDLEAVHSQLDFDVELNGNGAGTVHVTTDSPVVEPFVSFLVEYKWPLGRVLREYNVLLDPPSVAKRKQPATAPSAPKSAPAASQLGYSVKQGDNLWSIADSQNNDSSLSSQQVMVALFNNNPSAFSQDNMNSLRSGARLDWPSANDARQESAQSADKIVKSHHARWQQESAATADTTSPSPSNVARAEELAVTDDDSTVDEDAAADKAAEQNASEDGDSDVAEDALANIDLEAIDDSEVDETEEHDDEIEPQAEEDSAVELDEDAMAAIKLETDVDEDTESDEQASTDDESKTSDKGDDESSSSEDDDKAASSSGASDDEDKSSAEDTEDSTDKAAESNDDAKEEAASNAPSTVADEPTQDVGILGFLKENTLLLYGLLLLFVVIIALWLLRTIRSRQTQVIIAEDEDEALDEFDQGLATSTPAAAPVDSADELEHEADQLIANNQHAEAVPLLRRAINVTPSRIALKKKLLAALQVTNPNAFQQEVLTVKGTNEELDAYINELTAEPEKLIEPEPLADVDTVETSEASDVSDVEAALEAEKELGALDFQVEAKPEEPEEMQATEPSAEKQDGSDTAVDFESLSFAEDDLDMALAESLDDPQELDIDAPEPEDFQEAEDLENIESELEVTEDVDSLLAELDAFNEFEEESLDEPTETPVTEAALPEADDIDAVDDDLFGADLGDEDPVATRLDLAQIYLEMGDNDIAREALEEVLEEGNESQKAKAKALLDSLSKS